MSRHRSMMSEDFKYELAKELGVYDTVKSEGWGSVSSRNCGNMVTAAIKYAEKQFENQNR